MGSDEQALRTAHATWIAAANARDLATLLALMTDDVVFLNPGQPPIGRDAFPAVFTAGHEQFQLRCTSDLEEVGIVGDVAWTVCRDALSLVARAGGAASALAGHRLTVYRRQPDGRWLLARDAHTLTPVAG
jgi:uncharacterized protein (TIGR02246 family)